MVGSFQGRNQGCTAGPQAKPTVGPTRGRQAVGAASLLMDPGGFLGDGESSGGRGASSREAQGDAHGSVHTEAWERVQAAGGGASPTPCTALLGIDPMC